MAPTRRRSRRPARAVGSCVCGAPTPPAQTTVESGGGDRGRAPAAAAAAGGGGRDAGAGGPPRRLPQRDLGPTGSLREDGRRHVAHPQARRPRPGPTARVVPLGPHLALEPFAQLERPGPTACEVVAHVHDIPWPLGDAEHRVEGGDAVGLRRGDGQPLAHVVEPPTADPADGGLQGMQGRQQERPLLAQLAAAANHPEVRRGTASRPLPAGLRGPEHLIHGRSLLRRRDGLHQMEVHDTSVPITRGPDPGPRRRRAARSAPREPRWP